MPLQFLARQQSRNGAFAGFASASNEPFITARTQPTIFPTVLILEALKNVSGANAIRENAAQYVQQQMNDQGAWNYWDSSSPYRKSEPYPDDLDDTACALSALYGYDRSFIDGVRLGQFARLLVSAESKPGGPYNTWLADYAKTPQWEQIDIAVNANIGYVLSQQGATPRRLIEYLDQKILSNDISSAYYVGTAPVLYFLARWYNGQYVADLRRIVKQAVRERSAESSLACALLLIAACHLKLPKSVIRDLRSQLLKGKVGDHWSAEAFYIDPVYDSVQHYGGSDALTTSFALEALSCYDSLHQGAQLPKARQPMFSKSSLAIAEPIADADLKREYSSMVEQIAKADSEGQVISPATQLARAGGWDISPQTLEHLNIGSLNGWVAYTIYDNILDGTETPARLNVANVAMRSSYGHYLQVMPSNLVSQAFETMDAANAWELREARAKFDGDVFRIAKLPDYQQHYKLAERSWGHSLACSGVLLAANIKQDSVHYQALQAFFEHYLIVRQLNDDAHDWEEDISAGHMSSVVAMLLCDRVMPLTIVLSDELASIRKHFWLNTITEVITVMNGHIKQAQDALDICSSIFDITPFQAWLTKLQHSSGLVYKHRQSALDFMKAFSVAHVSNDVEGKELQSMESGT